MIICVEGVWNTKKKTTLIVKEAVEYYIYICSTLGQWKRALVKL